MTHQLSLIYASARPHLIAGVIKLWESRCRNPENIEWCIATDAKDGPPMIGSGTVTEASEERITETCLTKPIHHTTLLKPPFSRIRAYNEAAKMSTGNWLVTVADDWVPCDGWDERLRGDTCCGRHRYPVVIHVFDGHKKDLITHPIVSRAFYQQEGCLLNPEYQAILADDDLTAVAKLRARVVRKEIGFFHSHPAFGSRENDQTDIKAHESHDADRAVYQARKASGFPLVKI